MSCALHIKFCEGPRHTVNNLKTEKKRKLNLNILTRFSAEPISERLSVHLDRYVETLSSAKRNLFSNAEPLNTYSFILNSKHSTWAVHFKDSF